MDEINNAIAEFYQNHAFGVHPNVIFLGQKQWNAIVKDAYAMMTIGLFLRGQHRPELRGMTIYFVDSGDFVHVAKVERITTNAQ